MSLSEGQLRALEIVERTASGLSLIGILTIIGAFTFSKNFRNPMHRLIFLNTFYNLFDFICTMISVDGPRAGDHSALCQFQGFLNQMFPLADVLWTLAMAADVFLIVYYQLDTQDLQTYEWRYLTGITFVTFVPAVVFLFVENDEKGPMYGSVVLWCSIAPKWVLFRILFYYIPIWLAIIATMILYILVGYKIFKRRNALLSIRNESNLLLDSMGSTVAVDQINSLDRRMTTETIQVPAETLQRPPLRGRITKLIEKQGTWFESRASSFLNLRFSDTAIPTLSTISSSRPTQREVRQSQHQHQSAAGSLSFRQYVLMPLFFFIVLLAIWVAPTTNRVISFVNPSFISPPLMMAVGAMGSLRGFWNGVIFIAIGWKTGKRDSISSCSNV